MTSDRLRAVLITGSSHCGKSVLAAQIAGRLGWPVVATDALARHPGRPWPEPRPQVAEFYDRLSDDTIYWLLQAHHQNMAPGLMQRVAAALAGPAGVVFEGAALRPADLAGLDPSLVRVICLTGKDDVLRDRIRAASGYDGLPEGRQRLVDKFIDREARLNRDTVAEALRLGLTVVDSGDSAAMARQ